MAQTANSDYDALRDDLTQLRKDIDSLGKTMKQLVDDGVAEGKSRASAKVDDVRQKAGELGQEAGMRARQVTDAARAEIEARPFVGVMSAFAVGMALGWAMTRGRN
jgi:ElaB/YqjD/DUF883 family membrane-anchored ribosome-binding protein